MLLGFGIGYLIPIYYDASMALKFYHFKEKIG
jgi:hypothetical protein